MDEEELEELCMTEPRYKPGQTVICIASSGKGSLTVGEKYQVVEWHKDFTSGYHYTKVSGGGVDFNNSFYSSRFKSATPIIPELVKII